MLAAERAEINARAVGLGREHRFDPFVPRRERRRGFSRAREVIRQPHRASIDSALVTAISARRLFAPLGPTYDRYSSLLSFGQDPRWRRFLVSRVAAAAGDTGARRRDRDRHGRARARAAHRLRGRRARPERGDARERGRANARSSGDARRGRAESLPFADAEFDALTFTYLLRYVDDPAATLRELARVVRPGGTIAMLEFGLPRGVWRPLWELWVRVGLPLAGRLISPGWHEVGRFLGPSIRGFWARWPEPDLLELWRAAGIDGRAGAPAERRRRDRRLGTARVSTEPRPAFYALASGGWRDYVTLLHPPYTLWHLSYVAVGAGLATEFSWTRCLALALAAFALAMGVGAHALDELSGRPLQTQIPDATLWALAVLTIAAGTALGVYACIVWTPLLAPFVVFGAFIVVAYNLELFGGPPALDALVRARVGRLARAVGVRRRSGNDPRRGDRGRRVRDAALVRAARPVDAGARHAPARRRRQRDGRASDGDRSAVTRETLMGTQETALRLLAAAAVALGVALLLVHV